MYTLLQTSRRYKKTTKNLLTNLKNVLTENCLKKMYYTDLDYLDVKKA